VHRVADQIGGGLVAGHQEQIAQRQQLVGTDGRPMRSLDQGDICISVGTCLGDAGGPVLTPASQRAARAKHQWVWQALISRSTNDDHPCGSPVIATSLAYFRTWLASAAGR
jgi:hypothetical protein